MKAAALFTIILVSLTQVSMASTASIGRSAFEKAPVCYDADTTPQTLYDAKRLEAQIESDLGALSRLKFKNVSKNHLKFFSSDRASDIVNFIRARLHRVAPLDADDSQEVIARTDAEGTIHMGSSYFAFPQSFRWSTLVHEARHADPTGRWLHIPCPSPAVFKFHGRDYELPMSELPGQLNCDPTDEGAIAVQYTFLMSIVESCTNCSKKMKENAMSVAVDALLIRISDEAAANRLVQNSNRDPKSLIEAMPGYIKIIKQFDQTLADEKAQCSQ